MPPPPIPLIISGQIFSPKGIVNNATVTLTYETDSTDVTTGTDGRYQIDASEVNASNGNSVTLVATRIGFGTKSETITLATPQTQNFFLEQTSNLSFDMDNPISGGTKYLKRMGALLVDFEGNMITINNPLYVMIDNKPFTQKMINLSSGQPQYIGQAPPGTPTNVARWRIKKMEYVNGNTKPPTGELWANGNAEFDKIWDNYSSYDFS